MKIAEGVTESEIGLLVAGGVILTCGSIWWISGFAWACLTLGIVMLTAAWSCIDTEAKRPEPPK